MYPALPTPRDRSLADCVWLARFVAKARRLLADTLPPAYAERFGHPAGVDGNFFRFFGLTHEQMMDGLRREPSDALFVRWFLALPGMDAARVAEWNAFAEELGHPGRPMEQRLKDNLVKQKDRLDTSKIHSIFDLITADEAAESSAQA